MIKHIVMWEFLDSAEGKSKSENIQIIKEKLESLPSKIPEIKFMEVGVNVNPKGFDAVLYSEFYSLEALELYQSHPLHKEISIYCSKVRKSRVVSDYHV